MTSLSISCRRRPEQAFERSNQMALVGEPAALGDVGGGDARSEQSASDVDAHPELELVRRHAEHPAERAHEMPRAQVSLLRRVADADAFDGVRGDVVARADENSPRR